MFTLIELTGPSYNFFSISLSVLADFIMLTALYVAQKPKNDKQSIE